MDAILIFQFAKLYEFYFHPLALFLRALVFSLLTAIVLGLLVNNMTIRLPLGLSLILIMLEVFMRIKLRILRPQKTIQEVTLLENKANLQELLDTFTLPAASAYLKVERREEFLNALNKRKDTKFVLEKADIRINEVPDTPVDLSELALLSSELAGQAKNSYVTVLDLFAAYLLLTEEKTKFLFNKELKKEELLALVAFAKRIFPQELTVSLAALGRIKPWGAGIGASWVSGWTLETQKYTQDFTRKTLLSPPTSLGREKELLLLIEALLKSKRTNVLLIGEPGVGKKEIVSMFALRSFLGDTPKVLQFLRVLELLSGPLVAGTATSGELEERLGNILKEIAHAADVTLFIPEVQNISGAGFDALDVTGVLLPHLLDDKIRVIATVTPQNYKTFLEKKREFVDAFEKIVVEEPSKEEVIPMLLDAGLLLEKRHKVTYTYKAIIATIELSEKYMAERALPGKAAALLDEAAAKVRLSGKLIITKDDVVGLLEEKLPIKIGKPKGEEKELLLNLERILHERIIGQDEAVRTVSEAMRRLRSGLAFDGRPVGTFLFLGPTGVGKTETAKALASVYFGNEEAMIRFDMGEYQERAASIRLLDELAEKVRAKPFCLILLDELEKAYSPLLDVFLGVFEDGRLTDSSGRTVSFTNTIIIATSNAGSQFVREGIHKGTDLEKLKPILLDLIQKERLFKPELLNRFDAIVLFKPLGEREVEQVTELLLQKLSSLLVKQDISLQFDKRAVSKIVKEGFDQTMGARPLRRFIQDHVDDLLSQKLLRDEIKRGDVVTLSTDSADNLTLEVKSMISPK